MLNKEDTLALAWEHSEGSGERYIFTEENLFEFLKELTGEPTPAQKVNNVDTPEQQPIRLPERKPDFPSSDATGEDWENSGWNAALAELARLNPHLLAD